MLIPNIVNPPCMVAEIRRTQGNDEGEAPIWTVVPLRKQLEVWALEQILSSAEWREGVLFWALGNSENEGPN